MKNYTQTFISDTNKVRLFLLVSEIAMFILLAVAFYLTWESLFLVPVIVFALFYLVDLVFNIRFFKDYKKTNGFINVIINENHNRATKVMNNIISENKLRYEIDTAFYKSKRMVTFYMNICARRQNEFFLKLIKEIEK